MSSVDGLLMWCDAVDPCPLPWDYNQDGCNGRNLERGGWGGEPGVQFSGPGKLTGCQLNSAEGPRRWSSSAERPGTWKLEGASPAGTLVLQGPWWLDQDQKSRRNRLLSALHTAELAHRTLHPVVGLKDL